MKKIALIAFLFLLVSCNKNQKETYQPDKLKRIPENAFWIGGSDGGNWYVVENVNSHKNNTKISIYNDQTGELILSRKFMIICYTDNLHFIGDLKTQILSFDGDKIQLKNGCWLQ